MATKTGEVDGDCRGLAKALEFKRRGPCHRACGKDRQEAKECAHFCSHQGRARHCNKNARTGLTMKIFEAAVLVDKVLYALTSGTKEMRLARNGYGAANALESWGARSDCLER